MFQGSLNFTDFTFEHPGYAYDGSFALSWARSFDHILVITANIFTLQNGENEQTNYGLFIPIHTRNSH